MRAAVVVFPGSNCDHDLYHAFGHVMGQEATFVWHKDAALPAGVDLVALPGGFSYGDYLRSGALARFSPIMQDVVRFARKGGLVLGVCNGFQMLCEAGLLPGALGRNAGLRFRCKNQFLRVENNQTPFTHAIEKGQVLDIPIAHGDGRYYADDETLDRLEGEGQVVFRYCNSKGVRSDAANPNGSARDIAGIVNAGGNVLGMMPHPERHVEAAIGTADGRPLFESVIHHFAGA